MSRKKKCHASVTGDNFEPANCIESECAGWVKMGKLEGCSFVLDAVSSTIKNIEQTNKDDAVEDLKRSSKFNENKNSGDGNSGEVNGGDIKGVGKEHVCSNHAGEDMEDPSCVCGVQEIPPEHSRREETTLDKDVQSIDKDVQSIDKDECKGDPL